MSAALIKIRTKAVAADDPDPTLGVFTPPETEVFKPSSLAKGIVFGLVYAPGGTTFTSSITVFVRDATTKTWYRVGAATTAVGHRLLITAFATLTGPHDVWLGITTVTGGTPIDVYIREAV